MPPRRRIETNGARFIPYVRLTRARLENIEHELRAIGSVTYESDEFSGVETATDLQQVEGPLPDFTIMGRTNDSSAERGFNSADSVSVTIRRHGRLMIYSWGTSDAVIAARARTVALVESFAKHTSRRARIVQNCLISIWSAILGAEGGALVRGVADNASSRHLPDWFTAVLVLVNAALWVDLAVYLWVAFRWVDSKLLLGSKADGSWLKRNKDPFIVAFIVALLFLPLGTLYYYVVG